MKKILLILVILVFSIVNAHATLFLTDGLGSLQNELDNIANDGTNDVTATTDFLADDLDSYWNITATGTAASTMIVELASYANVNTFGIYDPTDITKMVTIFEGTADAGTKVTLSVTTDKLFYTTFNAVPPDSPYTIDFETFSTFNFGFFLESGNGYTYYSDSLLNNDGYDHLLAYQGVGEAVTLPGAGPGIWTPDEYILAWEDLQIPAGDEDFTDMVLMIESVSPIPEPSTLLLLGSGLIGLAYLKRRKS